MWSLADALKLQRLLDTAGIPFFIGPEKATSVEAVTSNFADGLSVQIMKVGMPWAQPVVQQYFPEDEPPEEKAEESDNLAIHCPKCHSTEVVFEDMDRGPENSERVSPHRNSSGLVTHATTNGKMMGWFRRSRCGYLPQSLSSSL